MKKYYLLMCLLLFVFFLTGCSDKPSSGLIEEQFDVIKKNVSQVIGSEYEAKNFTILREDYSDEAKKEYFVKFSFDINKPVFLFSGKDIPGELQFKKKEDKWECTLNTGNLTGLFNLFKSK